MLSNKIPTSSSYLLIAVVSSYILQPNKRFEGRDLEKYVLMFVSIIIPHEWSKYNIVTTIRTRLSKTNKNLQLLPILKYA